MATATVPDIAGEHLTRILALLDASAALASYGQFTLFADHFADGIAEHAFRLWASAHKCGFGERVEDWADGKRYRFFDLVCGEAFESVRFTLHFPGVPIVEEREPAPGVVIELPLPALTPANETAPEPPRAERDAEQMWTAWRPSDGGAR